MYDLSFRTILSEREKERERNFKSEYFRQRFIVSRSLMKAVLQEIIGETKASRLSLRQKTRGRVFLHGRSDIFLSLSYSGTSLALTLGKQKIGSDIEMVRQLDLRKVRACPLFDMKPESKKEPILHFLHQWTMLEAYAKLRDMNLYPIIHERFYFNDTRFISYLIDNQVILSLASDSPAGKSALLWIDPKDWFSASSLEKNTLGSSATPGGETYARS
jgi:4'-phosphopantetheinyl transferase